MNVILVTLSTRVSIRSQKLTTLGAFVHFKFIDSRPLFSKGLGLKVLEGGR